MQIATTCLHASVGTDSVGQLRHCLQGVTGEGTPFCQATDKGVAVRVLLLALTAAACRMKGKFYAQAKYRGPSGPGGGPGHCTHPGGERLVSDRAGGSAGWTSGKASCIPLGAGCASARRSRNDPRAPPFDEALEGLELKKGPDFPQGDKLIRKEDHQAFIDEFIFAIKGGKHTIVETVPKEKTVFPPACKFA